MTPTEGSRIPLWQALGNRRHDGPRGLNPRPPTAPGTTRRGGQEDPRETPRRAPPRPLREVSQDLSTSSVATLQGGLTDDRNTLDHHPPERPIQTLRPPPTRPLAPARQPPRHPRRGPHRPPQQPSAVTLHGALAHHLNTLRHHPPERPIQTLRSPRAHPLRRPRKTPSTPSARAAQIISTPSATTLPRGRHHPPERPIQTLRSPPAHPLRRPRKTLSTPSAGAAQTTSTPSRQHPPQGGAGDPLGSSATTFKEVSEALRPAPPPPRCGAPKAPRRAARPPARRSQRRLAIPLERGLKSPPTGSATTPRRGSCTGQRRPAAAPRGRPSERSRCRSWESDGCPRPCCCPAGWPTSRSPCVPPRERVTRLSTPFWPPARNPGASVRCSPRRDRRSSREVDGHGSDRETVRITRSTSAAGRLRGLRGHSSRAGDARRRARDATCARRHGHAGRPAGDPADQQHGHPLGLDVPRTPRAPSSARRRCRTLCRRSRRRATTPRPSMPPTTIRWPPRRPAGGRTSTCTTRRPRASPTRSSPAAPSSSRTPPRASRRAGSGRSRAAPSAGATRRHRPSPPDASVTGDADGDQSGGVPAS